MATLTHAKSRRLYSWWWDSHINPKNSKWLQENLTDMDIKVKAMIKLIEEDADSFARRAEMYYKKRPELMKLVEEFYRAYRALAERYDHATGALCQAHQTMEEAFPNQLSFALSDESPSGSSSSDTETSPHSPALPRQMHVSHDSNNSQTGALGVPSQFHDITRTRESSEENDALMSKTGLKQLSEIVGSGEEAAQVLKEDQNLKSQITSKSVLADNAEVEVQSLKGTISYLESDKEAALLQHQLSLERISSMEAEISRYQEESKKLNDEMLMVVAKLNSAEERCALLDKENQALQLNLDTLNKREKDQHEELGKNREELERLNISLQDEHLQVVQAETARMSLEKSHSQSQKEVRLLTLEVQSGIEKLKDMELYNMGLEEEVREIKEENGSLNEKIISSAFKIISLQDEIIFLKNSKAKIEEELGLHAEEKKVLQQEFSCIKEDRNDLRQRHHRLTEQIGAVNFNVESLQEMVKELQNGNAEVREICKKHEDEKIAHSENLKNMEKISEKIKTLEESSESLSDMLTVHLSEKELLISQLESIDQDMENLSERNIFLENSLFDANFELEGLRIKLKEVEESCRSLCAQNSNFLSEKGTLVSQVERTTQSLENLEMRYAELEGKHLNLEREKNLALLQVMVLQDSMKQEKEEYKTLILSSKSHLCTLENQISLLHEESRVREEEFDVEQHKIMDAHTEIFILQKCLCDMNEKNSILSVECQKLLVALNRADKLISELNQELLVQEKRLTASSEKLREGIQLTLRELLVDKHCGSLDGIEDEVLLQLTFHEVRDMLNSLSDARDEKQCLLLDKSVILTILEQFGVNLMDVTIEKNVLEQESSVKTKELSVLQIKELGLLEINEQLRQDVQSSNQKQEVLISQLDSIAQNMENLSEKNTVLEISLSNVNVELESLRRKSKDLEESCQSLCLQNSNHLSEKSTLVSQVESTTQSLVNLEMMYAELEGKYLKLGREKDLVLHQVIELQDSLQLEKEEYKTLDLSSKFQLSTLKNQISLLQEETRIREEEFEVEQHKIMDAQIEIFILQRCLYDTNEKKSILSVDCQKHLVQEKLISELKHQLLVRDKKLIATSGRSEKLREGIQLMLRELRVNNDSESLDGIKDEALLQLTLHENRNLHDENHRILLDKSVIVTILEQFGLNVMDLIMEKTDLERDVKTKTKELPVIQSKELELVEMNEQLRQDLRSSNQRQEVLCEELIDLREDHSTLQGAILKLLEENQSLSEKSNELKEKGDILEEENCIILAEAMTLEYLYLIHRNYSEEKSLELQSLSSDLDCLHGVKDELDQEVRLMNEKLVAVEVENESSLEECRRHLKILENDLNITRNVCRQLNQELESKRELLAQKDTELLEANKKFRSTQDKKTELCSNLEGLQLEIDTAMVVIGELENKIFCLLEDNSQRGNEIACLREANEVSNRELDRLHKGVEDLRSREAHLTSELQNEVDEVKSCEFEIATLLNDTHIATINAALFEEKVFELLITCESLEISAIIQKEILYEGISVRNSNVDELNEKIDRMEGENRGLKEELSACLLLVSTLWDDITSLEEHTLSLAKHPESNHREKQDSQLVSLQHNKSNQEQGELHSATVPAGILEFQKLHAKVQALEKLVIDTGSLLELEVIESNASLEAAMKGIEVLKSNRDSGQKESQISKDITMQLESSEEPGRDLKLQNSDARISNVKYEKMMNDIQLDLIRSSSQHENGVGSYESSTVDNAGTKDPIQELRETTERDYNTQMHKASSVTPVQEIEYEKIEAASIDEEKIEYPASEIVADKELSIDKLELQQKVAESNQEWNRKVMERLSSNAERLSALQTSLQQLRRNMEASEISSCDTSFESETIKAQLNEAEGAILESVDINTKLTRKAEDGSSSSGKQIEIRDTSRRQIAEHARRGSDKIGRLELDLQKIQYMLMKIEEEQENRRVRGTGSRRRIVLKDYLYGSIDGRRQKKGSSCGCRRPETKDD